MCVNGRDCLNLATHNYLGLVDNKEMEDRAVECIKKYGVGSCGPRGFYGTVGKYLWHPKDIAFYNTLNESFCRYSFGFGDSFSPFHAA